VSESAAPKEHAALSAGIELRRATEADAPLMSALARIAYGHYVERIGREPGPMTADYAELVRGAECWIVSAPAADVATNPVDIGYLVLREEADHLLLDNVAVSPDWQGSGIGRQLLAFAEGRARNRGRGEVRLFTHETMTENIEFYGHHGYRETHRDEQSGFRRVFMTKRL
jgi:ribosomal protein S18 acetylase RimI-like enzyme